MNRFHLPEGNGIHQHFEYRVEALYSLDGIANNGSINYLKYQDQIVAAVMQTRTRMNYIQYDFFLNIESLLEEK